MQEICPDPVARVADDFARAYEERKRQELETPEEREIFLLTWRLDSGNAVVRVRFDDEFTALVDVSTMQMVILVALGRTDRGFTRDISVVSHRSSGDERVDAGGLGGSLFPHADFRAAEGRGWCGFVSNKCEFSHYRSDCRGAAIQRGPREFTAET